MHRRSRYLTLVFAISCAVLGTAAQAATAPEVALRHVQQQRSALGLSESDAEAVAVSDSYTSQHSGVTHVYLLQRVDGLDVYGATANVNVGRDGQVLSFDSDLVRNIASSINRRTPVLDATQAATAAAAGVGLTLTAPLQVLESGTQQVLLSTGGISLSPIAAKLIYQPVDGAVRLAWNVEIEELTQQHWWSIRVDAENGAILSKEDYVDHEAAPVADGSSYRVFPIPTESPSHGSRSLLHQPADAESSPFGWHDTNGAAGPEFTTPRGNNVHAYADTVSDGNPDPTSEPNGGAGLDFDAPLDAAQEPVFYRDAAVINLFYMNNVMHDVFYRYGFTEAAGNFQVNNFGKGGAGNDEVRAEAQDGTPSISTAPGVSPPLNNANFATPVDGSKPRMQMYLWQPQYPNQVTVNAPSPIAGTYNATDASFGAPVPPIGITGPVVLANDGVGLTADACEPLIGFPLGGIALLERGGCSFTIKIANAEKAGAVMVIMHNNVPGGPAIRIGYAQTDTNVALAHIPSVMVSYNDGHRFRANLPLTANVARKTSQDPHRDGDFDNGIIAHEYGHGISNRLTGGRLNVSCLNNQEQMGEGWSDFLALVLTARPGDKPAQNRGLGTYAFYQPTDGFGIRPTPYSTDMQVNPATYDTIKTAAVPHGVGYVWASMLWEMYWELVNARGFNPDVYGHWTTGGNNLAIQLVMDGMKLQKCNPGFIDGRNAILLADRILTGGANQCFIWRAFAKRGLGFSAVQGTATSVADGTQAFDVPASCSAGISVHPAVLTASQPANTITTQTFTVQNGASGGAADLNWSIAETLTDCASPSDLAWVSVAVTGGVTRAGDTSSTTVTFNSAGLTAPALRRGKLCVRSNDPATPLVEVPLTLQATYDFRGFFGSAKDSMNKANAGATVPVQFSLGGSKGSNIFAAGSPSSVEVNCETRARMEDAEPAVGSLSHDASADRYSYKWRTQGDWMPGTCRALTLQLNDGTTHEAFFRFQ